MKEGGREGGSEGVRREEGREDRKRIYLATIVRNRFSRR